MRKKQLVWIGSAIAIVVVVGLCVWIYPSEVTVTISPSQRENKLGDEIFLDIIASGCESRRPTGRPAWYERIPFIGHRLRREPPFYQLDLEVRVKGGRQCVDPRAYIARGGGLGDFEPDESGKATVALNRFAVISEPGVYEVVASLTVFEQQEGDFTKRDYYSQPVDVLITPRTDQEMSTYIEKLLSDFRVAKTDEDRARAIEKLICTRDSRIVPALIEWAYIEQSPESALRGFMYISLDGESDVKDLILSAARKHGLVWNTLYGLQRFGCPAAAFKDLITKSLESDDPHILPVGAAAAAEYPHDSHMPRLIELAGGAGGYPSPYAIKALASNRTDDGVAAMKRVLRQNSRDLARSCTHTIRQAYLPFDRRGGFWNYGNVRDLTQQASDPNSPARWRAIWFLVARLNREELHRVKSLIEENSREIEVAAASDGLRVIEKLIDDPDRDVRDFVVSHIRLTRPGYEGRPLKPEDFPEIYEEYEKQRRNGMIPGMISY